MEKTLNDDGKLVASLIEIQGKLMPIFMNRQNDFTKAKYLDLSEILKMVKPVLSEHGVLMQQFVDISEGKVTVSTQLMNTKGEAMLCGGSLGPTTMKSANPTQMLGASVTYLRRFQAMTILGLVGEADDDESTFKEGPNDTPAEPSPREPKSDEKRQGIIDGIHSLSADKVFTDMDRLNIKASVANARTFEALQIVLSDTQTAYDEKSGGKE